MANTTELHVEFTSYFEGGHPWLDVDTKRVEESGLDHIHPDLQRVSSPGQHIDESI